MVKEGFARLLPVPTTRGSSRRPARGAENISKTDQVRGHASQTSNKVGQVGDSRGQNQVSVTFLSLTARASCSKLA